MIYGKRVIKINSDKINRSGCFSSIKYRNGSSCHCERIGGYTSTIYNYKKNTKFSSLDIDKININISVFCSETGISKEQLYNYGEKHKVTNSLTEYKLKKFPVKSISVLIKNDTDITNITNLSSVDMISGLVKIPNNIDGILSVLYIVEEIDIIDKKTAFEIHNVGITLVGDY